MHVLFAPGLTTNPAVANALVLGVVVAIVAGVTGTFAIVRNQAFAGHALTDVATTGGTAASYAGASSLLGFLVAGVLGGAGIELLGLEDTKRRDLATGVVLGAATGCSALLLSLDLTGGSTSNVTQTILFGSIWSVPSSTTTTVAAVGFFALVVVGIFARQLTLTAVSPELAAVAGVRLRLLGLCFIATLAVSVALVAVAIGSILSTALLIGPAACAFKLTDRLGRAAGLAAGIGALLTSLGIVATYDLDAQLSKPWPVSFVVVSLVLLAYLVCSMPFVGRLASRVGR